MNDICAVDQRISIDCNSAMSCIRIEFQSLPRQGGRVVGWLSGGIVEFL